MKTPRVQDFDPNAKVPELKSPLDGMPVIQKAKETSASIKSERPNGSTGQGVNARSSEQTIAPTNERSNVRRVIKRASYELYTDQIQAIRQLSLEDRIQGGKGNQSEMVRDALDIYLKQKGKKNITRTGQRVNAR